MAMAAQPAVILLIRPAIKLGDSPASLAEQVCCKLLQRPLGSFRAALSLGTDPAPVTLSQYTSDPWRPLAGPRAG